MMQFDSSITRRTQRGSITIIQTETDSQKTSQAFVKINIRLPPPTRPYVFDVQLDDSPPNIASFFCKPIYRVKTPIGFTLNALLTLESSQDTGASPNIIDKVFLTPAWEESVKEMESPQRQKTNRIVGNKEGLGPCFIILGDLHVCVWFRIVQNHAVDLLIGVSFIDQVIRRIFFTDQKILPWRSRPVAIISTKRAINSINTYNTVFNGNPDSQDDVPINDHNLCCVEPQITTPAYLQTAVLLSG